MPGACVQSEPCIPELVLRIDRGNNSRLERAYTGVQSPSGELSCRGKDDQKGEELE